ncbi:hypothetical protein GE09DRAFT_715351 [Coniochaeta sp. 2T2.1]|nr:hypothetical protein GE09DRAFT_715351 [Coniochaeta sp. 2T2.1]
MSPNRPPDEGLLRDGKAGCNLRSQLHDMIHSAQPSLDAGYRLERMNTTLRRLLHLIGISTYQQPLELPPAMISRGCPGDIYQTTSLSRLHHGFFNGTNQGPPSRFYWFQLHDPIYLEFWIGFCHIPCPYVWLMKDEPGYQHLANTSSPPLLLQPLFFIAHPGPSAAFRHLSKWASSWTVTLPGPPHREAWSTSGSSPPRGSSPISPSICWATTGDPAVVLQSRHCDSVHIHSDSNSSQPLPRGIQACHQVCRLQELVDLGSNSLGSHCLSASVFGLARPWYTRVLPS